MASRADEESTDLWSDSEQAKLLRKRQKEKERVNKNAAAYQQLGVKLSPQLDQPEPTLVPRTECGTRRRPSKRHSRIHLLNTALRYIKTLKKQLAEGTPSDLAQVR